MRDRAGRQFQERFASIYAFNTRKRLKAVRGGNGTIL
jgi:hypothetical protein